MGSSKDINGPKAVVNKLIAVTAIVGCVLGIINTYNNCMSTERMKPSLDIYEKACFYFSDVGPSKNEPDLALFGYKDLGIEIPLLENKEPSIFIVVEITIDNPSFRTNTIKNIIGYKVGGPNDPSYLARSNDREFIDATIRAGDQIIEYYSTLISYLKYDDELWTAFSKNWQYSLTPYELEPGKTVNGFLIIRIEGTSTEWENNPIVRYQFLHTYGITPERSCTAVHIN
jgi:hypothetical protein